MSSENNGDESPNENSLISKKDLTDSLNTVREEMRAMLESYLGKKVVVVADTHDGSSNGDNPTDESHKDASTSEGTNKDKPHGSVPLPSYNNAPLPTPHINHRGPPPKL